jgi:hypothetical protein
MTRERAKIAALVAVAVLVVVAVMLRSSSTSAGGNTSAVEPPSDSAVTSTALPLTDPCPRGSGDADGHEETAVAAALDLAAAPQDWLYLSDTDLETAVREAAAPASADRLVEETVAEVGLARDALARSPSRVWWIVRPLAWRVDTFTPGRAQVTVWTVSVLSAADVAMPQSDWTTTAFDLEWDGRRWLLVSTVDTPGPTPQLGGRDEAWEPEPFDDALSGFTRVGSKESS